VSLDITECRLCGDKRVSLLLDAGSHPRSFDFGTTYEFSAKKYELRLGQCAGCSFIQILKPIPAANLHPHFDWVKNKEPDDHAPFLVEELLRMGVDSDSQVLFLSKMDERYHAAMREQIGENAVLVSPQADLEIEYKHYNQAVIQSRLTASRIKEVRLKYGVFDAVVATRLVEHCEDPRSLILELSGLIREGGMLVIEVPDSKKPLCQGDLAMLWEEHIGYFTSDSLSNGLQVLGFDVERVLSWPYPQEDALAVIVRPHRRKNPDKESEKGKSIEHFGSLFREKFEGYRNEIPSILGFLHRDCGSIAVFGAGHRATMFLNLLPNSSIVDYVIDDSIEKQGLYMPGSRLEIVSTAVAINRSVKVVIFAVSVDVEPKIEVKMTKLSTAPIKFLSISPDSPYWLG
jgi:hypothetical protein